MSAPRVVGSTSDDAAHVDSASRPYSSFDLSAASFWEATAEEREKTFAQLREHDPVSWQRPIENPVVPNPDDVGYWAVARHGDITHVSKNSDLFISGEGVIFDDLPAEFLEMTQSFMAMDPPRHQHLPGWSARRSLPSRSGASRTTSRRPRKRSSTGSRPTPPDRSSSSPGAPGCCRCGCSR